MFGFYDYVISTDTLNEISMVNCCSLGLGKLNWTVNYGISYDTLKEISVVDCHDFHQGLRSGKTHF